MGRTKEAGVSFPRGERREFVRIGNPFQPRRRRSADRDEGKDRRESGGVGTGGADLPVPPAVNGQSVPPLGGFGRGRPRLGHTCSTGGQLRCPEGLSFGFGGSRPEAVVCRHRTHPGAGRVSMREWGSPDSLTGQHPAAGEVAGRAGCALQVCEDGSGFELDLSSDIESPHHKPSPRCSRMNGLSLPRWTSAL